MKPHNLEKKTIPWKANLIIIAIILKLLLNPLYIKADSPDRESITYLKNLSLEALLETEVTSVSRTSEKLTDAPAAIFVISGEEIRRSGVTTIPDALRMVPGLQVAKINSNSWMITSRGFAGIFAGKLLVQIDGRSVYSPLFSGVFWNVQDTLLEDIDRIEVIRGPGAALWGANAVNGIINIITKPASQTHGGLVSAGVGSEEKGFGHMRLGLPVTNTADLRVYGKYYDRDDAADLGGVPASDSWDMARGGFRLDWSPETENRWTLSGDIYSGENGLTRNLASLTTPMQNIPSDTENDGWNLNLNWDHRFSAYSDLSCRIYMDHTDMDDIIVVEKRDTFDIDLQHHYNTGGRQDIIWGLGYRISSDELKSTKWLTVNGLSRDNNLFSGFIQDRIEIFEEMLWVTLGSKFEHNDITGFEIQPGIRLLYKPHENHTLWAAVSRAIRTPSRGELDFNYQTKIVSPPGTEESEELQAFELGYRISPTASLLLDFTIFYNDYDNLVTPVYQMPMAPNQIPQFYVEFTGAAETFGAELSAGWQPMEWWKLQLGYTYLHIRAGEKIQEELLEDTSPSHQVSLRSSMDLPGKVKLDLWGRYVDELTTVNVDSYTTCDIRLAWEYRHLELALVGQNLLDKEHVEFIPFSFPTVPTEVERSFYIQATWRF